MTFTISNIQNKETTRGSGDALINVECSAKSLGPSFFYFLDIRKNIEIVQRPSQTATQANFMRGVFPSQPKPGEPEPSERLHKCFVRHFIYIQLHAASVYQVT